MKGSEKQIKWAEDIRAKIESEMPNTDGNEIGKKAVDYIMGIDDARFWIDYKEATAIHLLRALAQGTLTIKGADYNDRAQMDAKTGEVTITK